MDATLQLLRRWLRVKRFGLGRVLYGGMAVVFS